MIYQCYHKPEHRERLFTAPPYRGFGLEPELNSAITRRCPELEDVRTRTFLSEYGAMLSLWRNRPLDWHRWIGFTSYRQAEKTPFVFSKRREISASLRKAQIAGWGFHDVSQARSNGLSGAAAQFELCHPGGFAYMTRALAEFGSVAPSRFQTDRLVLYSNFWVMRKSLFYDFMEFSWPILCWCLKTQNEFDFVKTHPRSIGFAMERLFIVWYMRRDIDPLQLGPYPSE